MFSHPDVEQFEWCAGGLDIGVISWIDRDDVLISLSYPTLLELVEKEW